MKKEQLKKEIKKIIIDGIFCNDGEDDYSNELGDRLDEPNFSYGNNNLGYINQTLKFNFDDLEDDFDYEEIDDLIKEVWDEEIEKEREIKKEKEKKIIEIIKGYLEEAYKSELDEDEFPPSTRCDIIVDYLKIHFNININYNELRDIVYNSDDLYVKNEDSFYYHIDFNKEEEEEEEG